MRNTTYTYNNKQYELSNHLENVLVTTSDLRKGTDINADGKADYYNAVVQSANYYYSFGSLMPARQLNSTVFKYGFNGKELDKDGEGMGGGGSTYDYGFRIYNPSIAKFLSVDPLTKDYPFYTPYQFAANTPISSIDLDGLEMHYSCTLNLDEKSGHYSLTILKAEFIAGTLVNTYEIMFNGERYYFTDFQPWGNNMIYKLPESGGYYLNCSENSIDNLNQWMINQSQGVSQKFEEVFCSDKVSYQRLLDEIALEFAMGVAMARTSMPEPEAPNARTGTIYEVPGEYTRTGKPYVGRNKTTNPRVNRKANDVRSRTKANVVDYYNTKDVCEGQFKEQRRINNRGGKNNLDNKRDEVNPARYQELEQKYFQPSGIEIDIIILPIRPEIWYERQSKEQDYLIHHG